MGEERERGSRSQKLGQDHWRLGTIALGEICPRWYGRILLVRSVSGLERSRKERWCNQVEKRVKITGAFLILK